MQHKKIHYQQGDGWFVVDWRDSVHGPFEQLHLGEGGDIQEVEYPELQCDPQIGSDYGDFEMDWNKEYRWWKKEEE